MNRSQIDIVQFIASMLGFMLAAAWALLWLTTHTRVCW